MKLWKWKENLIKDLEKIRNWGDINIALGYYIADAKDMFKRNRCQSKRPMLVWWEKQKTQERCKIIKKAYNERKK